MAATTPRFGFNWYDTQTDGDLTDDGQKYTGADRLMLDSILSALEKHDHRVTGTTSDPQGVPLLNQDPGGELDGGTEYFYVISFITADGLETLAGPEASVTTPEGLATPDAPSVETALADENPTSQLTPGVYYYAVTTLRGTEESALSDFDVVTVLEDENTAIITLPDLGDATQFCLWRLKETDAQWTRIGYTTDPTFTDTGAVPAADFGDPANTPPEEAEGSDNYQVSITLTGDDLTRVTSGDVAGWRIYRTTVSGSYSAASLVHEVVEHTSDTDPTSPLLTSWVDDGDEPFTGAPKLISTQLLVPPFTFEYATTLPDPASYPTNYPILGPGPTLYIKRGTAWQAMTGGSGGTGGGGGFNYQGPWDAARAYPADSIVTYANGLWQNDVDAPAGAVPGVPTGGQTLPLIQTNTGFVAAQTEDVVPATYAQRFQINQARTVTSVQLTYAGNQNTTQNIKIGLSLTNDPDDMTVGYTGTVPSGSGIKTFTFATPITIPANTNIWLMLARADTTSGIGLDGWRSTTVGGTQSAGLTLAPSYSFSGTLGAPVAETTVNPGYVMLFTLAGTAPLVDPWDVITYVVPTGGTLGQTLTKTGSADGAYDWSTPTGGGSSTSGGSTAGAFNPDGFEMTTAGTHLLTPSGITVGPGEVWEIEGQATYSMTNPDGAEFYLCLNADPGDNSVIYTNVGTILYSDANGKTAAKFAGSLGLVGNGELDNGPAVAYSTAYQQLPISFRYTIGNASATDSFTAGCLIYLTQINVPGTTLGFTYGATLRAVRIV